MTWASEGKQEEKDQRPPGSERLKKKGQKRDGDRGRK